MPNVRDHRPVDRTFLDEAPIRNARRQALPVSADVAFRSLEDGEAWPQWLTGIERVEWTSPRPFGVGTTRDVFGRGS